MNRARVLRDKDKQLMQDFSSRCVDRLRKYLLLKVFLSLFQRFLDANFLKEVEKDGLVIDRAVSLFETGRERSDFDVERLFEEGKAVDEQFVKRVSVPPLSIEVRYDDIADIRKKRIYLLGNVVFDLLPNWDDSSRFSEILRKTYAPEQFRAVISEILHLYNLETRMLGDSITFHQPATHIKDLFADKLLGTMEEVSREIASDYTRRIYAGENLPCAGLT